MAELGNTLLEIAYVIIGLQFLHTAYRVFKDTTNPARLGTTAFWGLLGVAFVGGSYLPSKAIGVIVLLLAALTLVKQVKIGQIPPIDDELAEKRSQKIGNLIFLPVMSMAILTLAIAQLIPDFGRVAIAIAAILATIAVLMITRQKPHALLSENSRTIQQISTSGILPQLLGAVGAIFTAAGVGDVIAGMIGGLVPEQSRFFGVLAYVLGMVLFTMIMGNAFAAFTVITAGIGVPFVFALGANPIVAGALAMTAGYCGTLMTPMAANFNTVPVALMDMKNPNSVIKIQAPVALVMIVIHIALMYFVAFN